ncbi:uncharacterized protein [Populus alba]|uniref:uncharacterized protein n=1 Tax=Populus alba TaxID=43335 RepID=UPI003CC74486
MSMDLLLVSLEKAGIGGVRRDHRGIMSGMFSVPVGTKESNEAKLIAVVKALESKHRQDFAGKEFVIESDSANVVQWMNETSIRPWRYKDPFSLAERFSSQISFAHILREGNHCANVLAKQGVLKQWT